MKYLLEDYFPILAAMAILIICGISTINTHIESNKEFEKAIALEDDYDVYYNGKKVKGYGVIKSTNTFKIKALNNDKITLEVDDSEESIYINDINEDNGGFTTIPIFLGN